MSKEKVAEVQREKVKLEKPGRLERSYFWTNIERIFVVVFLALSVYAFGVSLASIASAIFMALYVLIVFFLSAFIVIFTLGLIFTIEDNIVVKMWALIQDFNMDKIVAFQKATLPGLAISCSILLVGALLLVILNRKNLKKTANIVLLIVGGSFYIIMLFLTIMMLNSK